TKEPLEGAAALHDPAAVSSLPPVTAAPAGAAGAIDLSAGRIRREHPRQLVRAKAFLIRALILLWWIVCALFGTSFTPYDPASGSLANFNAHPSGAHWFGTDSLGRDVFSRVIAGATSILVIAPLATLLGTVVGTSIGLVQGYFRGAVDNVVGRV